MYYDVVFSRLFLLVESVPTVPFHPVSSLRSFRLTIKNQLEFLNVLGVG